AASGIALKTLKRVVSDWALTQRYGTDSFQVKIDEVVATVHDRFELATVVARINKHRRDSSIMTWREQLANEVKLEVPRLLRKHQADFVRILYGRAKA